MDFLAIDLGNYAKSGLNIILDQDVSIHDMLGHEANRKRCPHGSVTG